MMIEVRVYATEKSAFLNPRFIESVCTDRDKTIITMVSGGEWCVVDSPSEILLFIPNAE